MSGEIGELVGENFEDRGVDLDSADVLGAEVEAGENVTSAAHTHDGDVGERLHQVGGIDDVIPQVGQLAEIAIAPGDDCARIRVDVEVVLVYPHLLRVGEAPAERNA